MFTTSFLIFFCSTQQLSTSHTFDYRKLEGCTDVVLFISSETVHNVPKVGLRYLTDFRLLKDNILYVHENVHDILVKVSMEIIAVKLDNIRLDHFAKYILEKR